MKLIFDKPLIDGLILSRPNRFIFNVQIGEQIVEAHCPSGGTIAGLSRKNMQTLKCYLSDHLDIYQDFVNELREARSKGLRQYQMNIRITKEYAELISFFENEPV